MEYRVWEFASAGRVVAHARWVGGPELFAQAPWPLARQIEAWFRVRVCKKDYDDVGKPEVVAFYKEELSQRLGLSAVPLKPGGAPERAAWLEALDADRIPAQGVMDRLGWASNRWSPDFDLDWLVTETARGEVRWSRGARTGFKAGGRCPDASEMWLTLEKTGSSYTLVLRRRRELWERPVRQAGAWFFKPPLQRLYGLLDAKP